MATMLLFTTFAGACILVGALAAKIERIRPAWLEDEVRHSIIAFGGGVLISAVALVLVPEGNRVISSASLALGGMFAVGAPAAPMLALLIGLQNLPDPISGRRPLGCSCA